MTAPQAHPVAGAREDPAAGCQNAAGGAASRPSSAPPAALTEAQWQTRVLDLAAWRGWLCYHTHNSRRSTPGYPDLTMVRGGRLIFAELKTARGRVTPDQQTWLGRLAVVPCAEVHLWRPADWPDVQKVLT